MGRRLQSSPVQFHIPASIPSQNPYLVSDPNADSRLAQRDGIVVHAHLKAQLLLAVVVVANQRSPRRRDRAGQHRQSGCQPAACA